MAESDETLRLVLDADASKVETARASVYEFAQTIEHVSGETYEFADDVRQVDAAMEEMEKQSKQTAAAARTVGAAAEESTKGMRAARQGMLDVARASQDFAQGGFPAIINNLEGIGRGLPAIAQNAAAAFSSLPTVLTLVGVAALEVYKNWDAISSLWETRNPVPELTDKLEALKESLKHNHKEMGELREKTSLSNDELKRMTELTAEQTRLEKEQDEEKKRRKELDKFNNLESDQEKEEASAFEKSIKGGGPHAAEDFKKRLAAALKSKAEWDIKEEEKRFQQRLKGAKTWDEKNQISNDFAGYVAHKRQDQTPLAEEMIRLAMRGNSRTIDQIEHLFTGGYGVSSGGFVGRLKEHRGEKERKAKEKKAAEAKRKADEKQRKEEAERRKNAAQADKDWRYANKQLDEQNREAKELEEKKEQKLKADKALVRPQIKQQIKEEDALAHRSGLITQAGYMQAVYQAQGMSGDKAYERTHQYVQRQLQQQYGVGEEQAWGMAARITGTARKEDKDKYQEAYGQAIQAGASVGQATIYANQQLLATMQAAAQQLSGQAGTIREQGRAAGRMRVQFSPSYGNYATPQ